MKKYGGYIALLVVFFVVFLGMRNPWLDQTPGPKRKGRAVVSSNTFSKNLSVSFAKSCKDHDHTTPLAIAPTTGMTESAALPALLPLVAEPTLISSLYLPLRTCRAPPASAS